MACWRVLELSGQARSGTLPQLLIKSQFRSNAYTVFLTDLTSIWSEELDLLGTISRAIDVESPIEVSERDTAQLAILLENVQKSLVHDDNTSCHVTRSESDDELVLHATISLPGPLDYLTWRFHLRKKSAVTLRNELILPLLVSSHIQYERISGLLSVISDKDRAITRLVDQYEASNLDLAAAFPSLSNAKSNRRIVKREQAAKHIAGLQQFESNVWKLETAATVDADVSTLGMFQEALSESGPTIPTRLIASEEDIPWWEGLENAPPNRPLIMKRTGKIASSKESINVQPEGSGSETEEEETEDEFETHDHFKSRDLSKRPGIESAATEKGTQGTADSSSTAEEDENAVGDEDGNGDEDEDEDEDEDLDIPRKSQGKSQRLHRQTETPKPQSPPPESSPQKISVDSPPMRSKAKGFKIGGRAKKAVSPTTSSQQDSFLPTSGSAVGIPTREKNRDDDGGAKSVRKGFRIGGRSKTPAAGEVQGSQKPTAQQDLSEPTQNPTTNAPKSTDKNLDTQALPSQAKEETEEEKVERKRRELKRKNEELAKKQAQSKKKKRF